VSARDTGGALAVFEFTGRGSGPRHLHNDQDEWIYVLAGECHFEVGAERLRLAAGESIFIPRKTSHVWACADGHACKVVNVYQPAGTMEAFFRDVSNHKGLPTREDVLANRYTDEQKKALHRLFDAHGMDLLGPPLILD
jgi:oxalate decarboxylase/phosphoglucose isomerase-like protein (cupin superfamily)